MSTDAAAGRAWTPLSAHERRVLGVLIEKQKTTPDNYPMTIAALVSGCNQKSNRDPVTNYDAEDVEATLEDLRPRGAVVLYEGMGRVPKWKHSLYEWFNLKNRPVELAVLAELLLRGPQTEGELRARASRMDAIPDLDALEQTLRYLEERGLVVYLSPPGQKRGVMVSHALFAPEELERLRERHAAGGVDEEEAPAARGGRAPAATAEELAALRVEVETLRAGFEELSAEVRLLKEALGS